MTGVTVLALLLALPAQAAAVRPGIRETLDVRYHTGSPRQVLDVFSPAADASKKHPVILFVHGGTWMIGDKDYYGLNRNFGRMFARNGYVAVLTNYRLSPFVRHPEHARDVARAYAWAIRNAARYGGDPSRIVLVGHSSGGHLATLVATDPSYLNDPELKLTAEEKAALKGVIGISGVYRIPDKKEFDQIANVVLKSWEEAGPGTLMARAAPVLSLAKPLLNPFWIVFGNSHDIQKKASPVAHARKGLPRFLLIYTGAEPPTLDEMAWEFARTLMLRGVPTELQEYKYATHRNIMYYLHNEKYSPTRTVLDFVGRVTGEKRPASE